MHNKTHRQNLKRYWRQWFPKWDIPKGYHVHHIKPKALFDDPNDPAINHPSNLIALHPDDHYAVHSCRGDKISKNSLILSLKGYKHSEETKCKIGESNFGGRRSDETKARMSKAQSGKNNPFHGKKHSLEKRKEIGDKLRGKYVGEKNSRFCGYYITPWGEFITTSEAATDVVSGSSIWHWCKSNDKKISKIAISRSKYLTKDMLGKTFKEIGFNFKGKK